MLCCHMPFQVSGSAVDWRISARSYATLPHSVRTSCGVSITSMHLMHRELFVTPIVNKLLYGRMPMTFLRSCLVSLIRLLACLFDATATAFFVCLHPSLFLHSVFCFFSVLAHRHVFIRAWDKGNSGSGSQTVVSDPLLANSCAGSLPLSY